MKGKITPLLAAILVFAISWANAEDVKRFSIKPEGGVTLGHTSVETGLNEYFGGSLELSLTSVLSLRGNFNVGTLASDDDPYGREFENNFMQYGASANAYLLKPFDFQNNWFNPYLTVGVGQINSDVEATPPEDADYEGVEYDETDGFINSGAGVQLNLGSVLDFFVQYQFHYTNTDLLDGFDQPFYASNFNDHYSTISGGLAFKIGSGDEHIAWHEREDEGKQLAEQAQRDLRDLQEQMEERDEEEFDQLQEEFAQFREEIESRIDEMETEPDTIVERVEREVEEERATDRETAIPDRDKLYIIGGSFSNRDNAETLKEEYDAQGYDSVIYRDDDANLYRVAIEEHTDENTARDRLNELRQDVTQNAWLLIP